jgi:Periplasmic component of the Tol biopolymer transport system
LLTQCDDSEIFNISPGTPIGPFEFSSVAFVSQYGGSSDRYLFTVDKSGNNMRRIVDMAVQCQKPIRSNSGTKLLFTAVKFDYTKHSIEYELYIVNIDGTGLTLINRIDKTENCIFRGAAWSPDDRQIVYVRSYDNSIDKTCLIHYNISDAKQTILKTEGNVCKPTFSPDGTKIAYCSSFEPKNNILDMNVIYENIYLLDINKNQNQLIIRNGAAPKWAPRGDKIAYTTLGKDRSSQISVANIDGSSQKQITSSTSPEWWDSGFPRGGNSDPQWTPDGKIIIYVSEENDGYDIYIMNADGSNKTRLTKDEWGYDPEVTSDGKYIIFSRPAGGTSNGGIYAMTLDGKNRTLIYKEGYFPVACR